MPWLSSRPPGCSSAASFARRRRRCCALPTCSTMPIEAIASNVSPLQLAVVHDADVDAVGDARPPRARCARELGLRLGERDAGDVHAVLARGVDARTRPSRSRRRARARPAAAPSLRQTSSSFVSLRLLERRRAARPDRARVGHRLVEEQREELVGEVVVVADRALVAHDASAAGRCGRSSVAGTRGGRAAPAAAHRGEREPAPSSRASIGGGARCRAASSAASMSSTSSAPATYARPSPSWPGARSTWPSASRRADGEGRAAAVGRRQRRAVPQLRAERAVGQRARRAPRAAVPVSRSTSTRFGGLALRGDAHDVPGQPGLLQRPDHPARRDRTPSARRPWRGGRRERVVVVVPGLAEREEATARQVARLVARSRSAAGRRSGRAS